MDIKSLMFVGFVSVVLVVYYLLQKTNWQKWLLLSASLVCMASMSSILSTALVVLLTLLLYLIALRIEKCIIVDGKGSKRANIWYLIGCTVDIGLLLYFKFFKWTYELLNDAIANGGLSFIKLVAPIGIAYYSLALFAYLTDVYHKKYQAERNFLLFLLYTAYFPAIIEGPINLYSKLMPQLKEKHQFDENKIVMGFQRILWGYFKKVVIADRIGIIVMGILHDETAAGIVIFWSMVLYSFQIYADFSGGIDVIMGISESLDIKLKENFKSPLISNSVTNYWARWHMSLGEFMEKYVYYPIVLNGNVMKFSKKIKNKYFSRAFAATFASVVVFIIVGIWHGTGWNYVVYGVYQAFWVSTAILMAPVYKKLKSLCHIDDKELSWKIFTALRTFVILVFGRLLIKAPNLTEVETLLKKMFSKGALHLLFDGSLLNYGLDYKNMTLMYILIVLMIVIDILHEKGVHFRSLLMEQNIVFRYLVYYVVIFAIVVFGIYGPEFSSASFIYAF